MIIFGFDKDWQPITSPLIQRMYRVSVKKTKRDRKTGPNETFSITCTSWKTVLSVPTTSCSTSGCKQFHPMNLWQACLMSDPCPPRPANKPPPTLPFSHSSGFQQELCQNREGETVSLTRADTRRFCQHLPLLKTFLTEWWLVFQCQRTEMKFIFSLKPERNLRKLNSPCVALTSKNSSSNQFTLQSDNADCGRIPLGYVTSLFPVRVLQRD